MGKIADNSETEARLPKGRGRRTGSPRIGREQVPDPEEFTQTVLDSLSDHIAVLDGDGRIVAVNEAWLRFALENGGQPFTMIGPGVNYLDICQRSSDQNDEIARIALDGIRSVMDGSREIFTLVYPCHSPRERRWFLMKVQPFKLQRAGVVVSHSNITTFKKTEDLLDESEKRLSYMLEAATEGTFDWNVRTGEVYYSPNLIESLGYSPDEVPAHVSFWESIVHPEDMPMVQKVLKAHLDGKTAVYDVENRLRKKSGEYRWNHARGKVVEWDADKKPLRMVGIEIDVTERKLIEEEIKRQNIVLNGINTIFQEALSCETEEQLARTCLKVAEGVTDSKFGFICEIRPDGLLHNLAISDPGWELCTMSDKTGHRQPLGSFKIHGIYGRVLVGGKAFYTNDPASHPDSIGTPEGHPALEAFLGAPLLHGDQTIGMIALGNRQGGYRQKDLGSLEALVPAVVEVLHQFRAEKAIQQSEARLNRSQEVAHLGSWELDLVNNVLTWSDEAYRIFGLRPQEFTGTYEAFLEAVHPDDRAAVDAAYSSSILEGSDVYEVEHRIVRKSDGEVRIVHEKCDHFRDSTGRIIRSVGIIHDITEGKLKEKELQSAYAEIKRLKELAEAENIYLRKEIKLEQGIEEIVGQSDALKHVLYRVKQVAPTDITVLLCGETGTGKGRIAYAIHKASNRRDRPLIHVNCAALPANLIESEMFGREKGAFTGAEARQMGRFELANQGTMFLDEIGELSLALQAKLLRVIEDGEFERLGSPNTIKVDVRIIASTNRNLEEEIKGGRFREDLYYRLNVFPITVPPLRQRGGDVVLLVQHFVNKFNTKYGKNIINISKRTMDALQRYTWPGNVRELANVIERAVIISHGHVLELSQTVDVPVIDPAREKVSEGIETKETKGLIDVEREHILKTLRESGWRVEGSRGAAQILGMNPSTLRGRMKKLGIKRPKGH